MLPTEWGPIVWYNFHILSYSYDHGERLRYIKFFKSMPYILPCLVCIDHFKKTLQNSPPEKNISNRKDIIKWLNNIHNTVNRRLNKRIISLKDAEKIYYNNNGNLRLNHNKMINFLKIAKKYLSSGISSIIKYHGENIIINYCYICPCQKCRLNMITLVSLFNLKRMGLYRLVSKMIDILSVCGKSSSIKMNNERVINDKEDSKIIEQKIEKNDKDKNDKDKNDKEDKEKNDKDYTEKKDKDYTEKNDKDKNDEEKNDKKKLEINNIELTSFVLNQNAYKIMIGSKLKVISKQIGSTPGVKKTLSVKPGKIYRMNVEVIKGEDINIIVWIKDLKTGKTITYDNLNDIEYHNKITRRVDMGVSLKSPKYNDIFYLNKFTIAEL